MTRGRNRASGGADTPTFCTPTGSTTTSTSRRPSTAATSPAPPGPISHDFRVAEIIEDHGSRSSVISASAFHPRLLPLLQPELKQLTIDPSFSTLSQEGPLG